MAVNSATFGDLQQQLLTSVNPEMICSGRRLK